MTDDETRTTGTGGDTGPEARDAYGVSAHDADVLPPGASLDHEPALDLRAWGLAPSRDAAGLELLARRIEAAAAPELARRQAERHTGRAGSRRLVHRRAPARAAGDLAPFLARALRPALLAAAAAVALAVGLGRTGNAGAEPASGGQLVSDASAVQVLSLHDPNAQWVDQTRAPSTDALGRAIGLGGAP